MKIDDYSIDMYSTHELVSWSKTEESLVQWKGGEEAQAAAYNDPVKVSLSPEALEKLKTATSPEELEDAVNVNLSSSLKDLVPKIEPAEEEDDNPYLTDVQKLEIKLIEELLFMVTGKRIKIKVLDPEELEKGFSPENQEEIQQALMDKINTPNGAAREDERVGWGLDYTYHEEHYEKEKTAFSTEGLIKTADGREIRIDVKMRMTREVYESFDLSVKAGDALIDPLVINYGGSAADLADAKFEFDLDMDGKKDEISSLMPGSGYLALDRNGDGTINDGGELFGPSSGSGFEELAEYDEDGNGWIDENDSVFEKLKIWNVDPVSGRQTLVSIGKVGVGAIYLGNASTEFSLTGMANSLNGKVRDTGIFLWENGGVGTVQELDLVV